MPKGNNPSGYKGVTWDKRIKKYKTKIWVNGKSQYLGAFDDPKIASDTYQAACKKYGRTTKEILPDGYGKCFSCQEIFKKEDMRKSRCIECHKIKCQKYYYENRERLLLDCKLKKFKLTEEEYKKLEEIANGKCEICNKDCDKLNLDHNHTTGKIRGLLCSQCNTAIGLVYDDVNIAIKLAQYISDHEGIDYE